MNIVERLAERAARRREQRVANGGHYRDDHDALGGVLGNLDCEYRLAVQRGTDRRELGRILSALAGCELAEAYLCHARGWDRTSPGHSEATRLSGLLLLELSWCATEGTHWRGVRHPELEPVAGELRDVALAYAGWAPNPHGNLGDPPPAPATIGQRLGELMDGLWGLVPGQPTETLAVLADIHQDGTR